MKRAIWFVAVLLICLLFVSITGYQATEVEAKAPLLEESGLANISDITQYSLRGSADQRGILATSAALQQSQESPAAVTSEPGESVPGLSEQPAMIPPADCGVPESGLFGRDVEILLNDRYFEVAPAWHNQVGLPCADSPDGDSEPASDIAVAALNTSSIVAVWRERGTDGSTNHLYYSIWNDGLTRGAWDEVAYYGPFSNGGLWGGNGGRDNYNTIHSADIDGDGVDELLGRWDAGMEAYRFNVNTGHWELEAANGPFPNSEGWGGDAGEDNYMTIHSGDVNGDGIDELVARSDSQGIVVYQYDKEAKDWGTPLVTNRIYANDQLDPSFDYDNYPTFHLANIDGLGADELLVREDSGMKAWRLNGDTWETVFSDGPFSNDESWGGHDGRDNYNTIHSADIDGDGVDELLGRWDDGMIALRYHDDQAQKWELVAVHGPFSNNDGWGGDPGEDNYKTIHSGDIDGDGINELLGRGDDGMTAYRFNVDTEKWELVAANGPFTNSDGWHGDDGRDNYSTIHSGDIDGDGIDELLGRGDDGMTAWRLSLAPGAWASEEGAPGGLTADGNPAVLASGGNRWEIYARNGGQFQVSAWANPGEFSTPMDIPGVNNAASDPMVISRGPGRTALFYQDSLGSVWFTEREGTEWREQPLPLRGTIWGAYLPLLIRSVSMVDLDSTDPGAEAVSPAVAQPPPTMNVLSRNENHLAVFIVDQLNNLWLREWTTANESDWLDTSWVKLMTGVAVERPAVASRHSNHMSVAVRDASGKAQFIEWRAGDGWSDPAPLGQQFGGPLSMAVPGTREMVLFGPDGDGFIQAWHWRVGEGWQAMDSGPSVGGQQQTLSTVVRRGDDVMVLARTAESGLTWHYTSQRQPLAEHLRTIEPAGAESYRNQVLTRVGERSYYLALDKAADKWRIEAHDLDGDVEQSPLTLQEHVYVAGTPLSMVASDVDFDGSDELLVATYVDATHARISVVDLSVVSPTLTLAMDPLVSLVETFTEPVFDFALTAGDLDGDYRPAEMTLVWMYGPKTRVDAWAMIYQFVDGEPAELQRKISNFQLLDNYDPGESNWQWELDAATGRLGFGGGQLVLAITGERNCPGCNWMSGYVNIFRVEMSDTQWLFTYTENGGHVAAHSGDPDEFPGSEGNLYRSAVATGDMDADGYEEIAAWYLNRVYFIDANDLTAGAPTINYVTLEPHWPGHQDHYWQSPRSLAVDDIDQDGRAEVAAAAILRLPQSGTLGFVPAVIELLGDGQLHVTGYGEPDVTDPGLVIRHGTVLLGDMDGDGLISGLIGCQNVEEYSVVAVLNGLPRPYENDEAIFDSMGSYSSEFGSGGSEESGTSFKVGASLTVGFEQEINVPLIGTKVGEVRASVTRDFMSSLGMSQETSDFVTYADSFTYSDDTDGYVVYNEVGSRCYYYELFSPSQPDVRTRAMACDKPGSQSMSMMTLELWHSEQTKGPAGTSWVDVGHRAPDGTRTNDLAIPGNYSTELPVDDYLLLFTFDEKRIAPQGAGGNPEQTWSATEAHEQARTRVLELETNTTVSVGATAGGVTMDAAATFGVGLNSSNTVSWSSAIMFAGGYSWPANEGSPYYVVPFVYQATARTEAGATYPYWVMDYYVPQIGP